MINIPFFKRKRTPLKICVLITDSKEPANQRFVEEAEKRGHEVYVVEALRCYMNITSGKPSIHYKGVALPNFDAIIPRIMPEITAYATAVLRTFEMMGVYTICESFAITRSRDKLRSTQLLAREHVGLPATGYAHSPDDIPDLLNLIKDGKGPFIIKLIEGTQGIGVVKAEDRSAAKAIIEAFMGINANIMVQEYIEESKGADIRCFVVGDQVIAAIKRQAPNGEFRSNLHRGGSASVIELSSEETACAIHAAKIMGLDVCGVDILQSHEGPVVMEVNSCPGLKIEKATGINIVNNIIEHIENNISNKKEAVG